MSPATIDRILRPLRESSKPKGISTTKSGILLKRRVPVRTFADWNDTRPGFFEADLVAHCGWTTEGAYLNTLVLTDIGTGWTECIALLHHTQHAVIEAIEAARRLLPFPMVGLDSDNGSEFLNGEMLAYCEREKITFTRGRAYRKNDQCFVEQKNGAVVRHLVGYDRFEGQRAWLQLRELYRAIRLYVNFFQPSMKLQIKHRDGAKVQRIYEKAKTPFQRVSEALHESETERLSAVYKVLDPIPISPGGKEKLKGFSERFVKDSLPVLRRRASLVLTKLSICGSMMVTTRENIHLRRKRRMLDSPPGWSA